MNNHRPRGEDAPTDWRAHARALAMQSLTQLDVQGDDFLMEMDRFIAEADVPSDSKTLAGELARLAWNKHESCDQFIADTVKHWQIQRIALIDRAILRLAIAELLYRTEVPIKVVLDQAIELAKRYSTAEAPQFVNGVLDAIAKKIQEPTATEQVEPLEPTLSNGPVIQVEPAAILPSPEEKNEERV